MKIPLLPVCLTFIVGLLLGDAVGVTRPPIIGFCTLWTLGWISYFFAGPPLRTTVILTVYAVLGWSAAVPFSLPENKSSGYLDADQRSVYLGELIDWNPTYGSRGQATVAVQYRCENTRWTAARATVLLFLEGIPPPTGSFIRFRTTLKRIEPAANPGVLEMVDQLERRQIMRRGTVKRGEWSAYVHNQFELAPGVVTAWGNRYFQERQRWRIALKSFFLEQSSPDVAGLLVGLTLGDRSVIEQDTRNNFARAGLAHLLAISGSHFALVAASIYLILRCLLVLAPVLRRRGRAVRVSLGIAAIPTVAYALLVGINPAILRALLMTLLVLSNRIMHKRVSALSLLVLSTWVILLAEPAALWDVGLQLSCASVTALLLIAPRVYPFFEAFFPGWAYDETRMGKTTLRLLQASSLLLATSIAAMLGTLPVCSYYFYELSSSSLLANVIVVPLLGTLSMPFLFAAMTFHMISVPIDASLVWVACRIIELGVQAADFFGEQQLFPVIPFKMSSIESLIACLLLVLLACIDAKKLRRIQFMGLMFFTASIVMAGKTLTNDLVITQLNVGQGDATVIELPNGKVIVVDGGGSKGQGGFDPGTRILYPFLLSKGIYKIDLMVLTVPHQDHYAGLFSLAEKMPPRELWVPSMPSKDSAFQRALGAIQDRGVSVVIVDSSSNLPGIGDAQFRCLNPIGEGGLDTKTKRPLRDFSMVLEFRLGKFAMLFTGDIDQKIERELLRENNEVESVAITKVPYHGNCRSSSPDWVSRVKAQIALVSVGKEKGACSDVVRRWRSEGTMVFRTDKEGAIEIRTSGRDVEVKAYGGVRAGQVHRFSLDR